MSLWSSTLSWTLSPVACAAYLPSMPRAWTSRRASIRLVGTNVELRGRDIYRHLKDARFAALMACTLGMDAERRLRTTGAQQPLRGAVLDAACSAYVEAAVEQMDQQVKTAAAAHRTRRQLAL